MAGTLEFTVQAVSQDLKGSIVAEPDGRFGQVEARFARMAARVALVRGPV